MRPASDNPQFMRPVTGSPHNCSKNIAISSFEISVLSKHKTCFTKRIFSLRTILSHEKCCWGVEYGFAFFDHFSRLWSGRFTITH